MSNKFMMCITRLVSVSMCIAVLLITARVAVCAEPLARTGDYDSKPRMELDFSQLEVHLEIGFESHAIRGDAHYTFRPKHAFVERIHWIAREMDIESVSLNGQNTSFRHENDTLTIEFGEYLRENETVELRLLYKAEPTFGVHFKPNGTVFTSNLPGSVAHWLPGPVHPRASMPVRLAMEVPEDKTAISSGDLDRQVNTDKGIRYIRVSNHPVPISEIGFAVGSFNYSETFSGTKSLGLFNENNTISDDERQELLENLVRQTSMMERFLRSELPVNSLQVLVLEDDRWETRPYSAGIIYLFRNKNQLNTQLDRSISAQWFGISMRTEKWKEKQFSVMLQAAMAEELGIPDWESYESSLQNAFAVPETIYNNASMEKWQWARVYIRNQEDPVLSAVIRNSLQELITHNATWTNYNLSDYLYEKTGRWIDIPDLEQPQPEPEYIFHVSIEQIRGSERYRLTYTPEADLSEDSFPVTVYWVRDGRIFEREVTFEGRGGSLEIDPGGHISNIWIGQNDESGISFTEEKAFSYWLYQLRRDDNAERRKKAADALRHFTDDPDLQLALQDRVNREEDTEVTAALYRVLSEITAGASGTERRFLEGITSSHPEIRMVSMEALNAYAGNQRVEDEVLRTIQTSDDIKLVNKAISTYRHLLEEDAYRDFVLRFLSEDRQDLLFTGTLLEELFNVPLTNDSVEMAEEYLHYGYSYQIRWLSYRLLRSHADNSEWQISFANRYAADPDPRIRFLTLFSLSAMNFEERGLFLEDRMLKEYDIRILQRVKEMLMVE